MKILFCTKCHDIKSFYQEEYTKCSCGNMEAKWKNGAAGTVSFRAKDLKYVRFIGLHNVFLYKTTELENKDKLAFSFDEWQKFHNLATVAPGYLFDTHNRNCWACVIKPGETNDVFFSGYIKDE